MKTTWLVSSSGQKCASYGLEEGGCVRAWAGSGPIGPRRITRPVQCLTCNQVQTKLIGSRDQVELVQYQEIMHKGQIHNVMSSVIHDADRTKIRETSMPFCLFVRYALRASVRIPDNKERKRLICREQHSAMYSDTRLLHQIARRKSHSCLQAASGRLDCP